MIKDLRPVVVRGLANSGTARVVVDSERVVVVTKDSTVGWVHDGEGMVQVGVSNNKWTVTVPEVGVLTVVKAGGCTCGKPWLKKGTGEQLLAGVGAGV